VGTAILVVLFVMGAIGAVVKIAAAGREKQAVESSRLQTIDRRYSDAAPVVRSRIIEKTIWIGMTEQHLIDSWGQPSRRNVRVLKTKIKHTFTYGSGKGSSRVFLDNGIVTGWSQ
jgi:hypothetical protein